MPRYRVVIIEHKRYTWYRTSSSTSTSAKHLASCMNFVGCHTVIAVFLGGTLRVCRQTYTSTAAVVQYKRELRVCCCWMQQAPHEHRLFAKATKRRFRAPAAVYVFGTCLQFRHFECAYILLTVPRFHARVVTILSMQCNAMLTTFRV